MPKNDNWKPTPHRDPVSGARKPDEYFTVGGKANPSGYGTTGDDISGKIEREQRRTANPGIVRK
jgi:hypothetical protein